MAHNTSGLPPLDIEPFDPSQLYAAASSPDRQVSASRMPMQSGRVMGLVLVLVAVVSVVAIAVAVL